MTNSTESSPLFENNVADIPTPILIPDFSISYRYRRIKIFALHCFRPDMLRFLTLKIQKYLIWVIVISSVYIRPNNARKQRYVSLTGCESISTMEYECCINNNLANVPPKEYCVNLEVIPNELTLNYNFKADGETFYNGKIDPSNAPICPPPSPLCLTVNYVNIDNREICTKLGIGPLTLVKFPCFGINEDGQILVIPNMYLRKK
ncbi:uncharacterized protein LOC126748984 [Anthonomus grandis grandis]|uniref:uncharacterized protein LOC126748984 n=1 Tax=Anthonomus grandis grandis TaxID=2921223 RepID=UPI002165B898|nr:uncharacterized protein LOC126748984 [Anthonomus grandis grandis]